MKAQDKKIIKIIDFDKEKNLKKIIQTKNKDKNILMKKENINNYYTDEDLINFEKVKKFQWL